MATMFVSIESIYIHFHPIGIDLDMDIDIQVIQYANHIAHVLITISSNSCQFPSEAPAGSDCRKAAEESHASCVEALPQEVILESP